MSAPRLEPKLRSFVCAVALRRPKPASVTKASMKKEPVPGPNAPS